MNDDPTRRGATPFKGRTRGRFVACRLATLFSFFVLGSIGLIASAQAAFDLKDPSWEGTSELLGIARARLGTARVRVVARLDFGALSPKDGLLILHPEVDLDQVELSAFLSAGGRLAVLDDFGTADRLLARYRIFRVQAPLRPALTLRSNPALALALPAVSAVAGQEQNRHPIVTNVERVVTNHPSALMNPNLTPVLTIPALGEPDATLAVTGVIAGRGRLFAMADPSVVINLMLRYPGNRAFAEGLVEYLVEDDTWGTRGGSLYILANRLDQNGRFGRTEGLRGDLNSAASSVSETLAGWHREGVPPQLALALAALAALGAAAWAGYYALRQNRAINPRYAAIPLPLTQGGLPGRAAVLAAPSTDRALVLSELDGLLQDELADRAGLPKTATPEAVLEALRSAGQNPSVLDRARRLFQRGRSAREAILYRRPSRIRTGRVAEYAKQVDDILLDLDRPRT